MSADPKPASPAPRRESYHDSIMAAMRRLEDAAAPPWWEPRAEIVEAQRFQTRGIEFDMADAFDMDQVPVDAIDAMAVAVRRIEAGDTAGAQDRLERMLGEIYPDWRRVCPW